MALSIYNYMRSIAFDMYSIKEYLTVLKRFFNENDYDSEIFAATKEIVLTIDESCSEIWTNQSIVVNEKKIDSLYEQINAIDHENLSLALLPYRTDILLKKIANLKNLLKDADERFYSAVVLFTSASKYLMHASGGRIDFHKDNHHADFHVRTQDTYYPELKPFIHEIFKLRKLTSSPLVQVIFDYSEFIELIRILVEMTDELVINQRSMYLENKYEEIIFIQKSTHGLLADFEVNELYGHSSSE